MSTFSQALSIINQFLGTRYVWGGNDQTGVDCSGFTRAVYAAMGIELPRVSFQQANAGTAVSRDQAQPGDLVSWDLNGRNPGADHVGIYMGNGKVAEASSSRGQVVIRNLWGNAQFHRFQGVNGAAPAGGVTQPLDADGQLDVNPRPEIDTTNPIGTQDNRAAFGNLNEFVDEEGRKMLEDLYSRADDDDPGEREDTVGPYHVARLMMERDMREAKNRPTPPRPAPVDRSRPMLAAGRFNAGRDLR